MSSFRASFALALLLVFPLVTGAQQQQSSRPRSGWPCGGRLDPSYFQVAEGTGGQLFLLAPEEVGDSAPLLMAASSHPHTIFRLAGTIPPGPHDFRVAIDPSVESVVFSVSVQCLQVAEILRPSGEPAAGDRVTDLSNFRAERMVIVTKPEPGLWTIRVAGSGVAGVVVQAKSALALATTFAPAGTTTFGPVPRAGVENIVRIRLGGRTTETRAWMMSGGYERIGELRLAAGESEGEFVSRFMPDGNGFRVLVTGQDANGVAFQRMTASLINGH